MNCFISVAEASSLSPGEGRTVHAQGREFALWNLAGTFVALDDACPHKGGSLGAGTIEAGRLICPLHGWEFDPRTGGCFSNPRCPVKTYPTRVLDGEVQICFE